MERRFIYPDLAEPLAAVAVDAATNHAEALTLCLTEVSDLIDPVTGMWDEQLVRDLFWAEDAELIPALPIREDMEDIWAWHYDTKGQFSVKSAYKLSRDLSRGGEAGDSGTAAALQFDWNNIWKLPCPASVCLEKRGVDCETQMQSAVLQMQGSTASVACHEARGSSAEPHAVQRCARDICLVRCLGWTVRRK